MNKVEFIIHRISADMCRITANSILEKYKRISDGGCITDIETLLAEMQEITRKTREHGGEAIFTIQEANV